MQEEEIIKKLKNDEEYYGEFGKLYLSQSDISTLLHDPNMFHIEKLETPDSVKNFEIGKYFHYLMLEPEKAKDYEIIDVKSRRTKKFEEAWNKNKKVLTTQEAESTKKLTTLMQSNEDFSQVIYKENNLFEHPGIIKINDTLWKGKADIITEDNIIDLKTTSDIHRFKYNFYTYYYSSQAWLYEKIFGKPMLFFVACKKTGILGKFTIDSDRAKEHGETNLLKAIENYNQYCTPEAIMEDKNFYVEYNL